MRPRLPAMFILSSFILFAVVASAQDDLNRPVAEQEAQLERLRALRKSGTVSEQEVMTAELGVHAARAKAARDAKDVAAETKHREAAVAVHETLLKRAEALRKSGVVSEEEIDGRRLGLLDARVTVAHLRNKPDEAVALARELVAIAGRRADRAQKLYDAGALSKVDLDRTTATLDHARRRLTRATDGRD